MLIQYCCSSLYAVCTVGKVCVVYTLYVCVHFPCKWQNPCRKDCLQGSQIRKVQDTDLRNELLESEHKININLNIKAGKISWHLLFQSFCLLHLSICSIYHDQTIHYLLKKGHRFWCLFVFFHTMFQITMFEKHYILGNHCSTILRLSVFTSLIHVKQLHLSKHQTKKKANRHTAEYFM